MSHRSDVFTYRTFCTNIMPHSYAEVLNMIIFALILYRPLLKGIGLNELKDVCINTKYDFTCACIHIDGASLNTHYVAIQNMLKHLALTWSLNYCIRKPDNIAHLIELACMQSSTNSYKLL